MTELAACRVPLLGRRPHRELFGPAVELRDGALIHHADPRIAILVDLKIERAERPAGLDDGDRVLRDFAGLHVHLAEEHLAEVRVPGIAVVIEHHVMRLDVRTRQVVFGDNDSGRLAREPRQSLERKFPGLLLVEVNAGEPLGSLPAVAAIAVAQEVAGETLWPLRRAA